MENLELKNVNPYLAYGLKVKYKEGIHYGDSKINAIDFDGVKIEGIDLWVLFENIKPFLHPLSDLTKEIEVNGERFYPLNRLYKERQTDSEYDFLDALEDDWASAKSKMPFAPYAIYQKLISWHFDTQNLIEKGLAIDINTIENSK